MNFFLPDFSGELLAWYRENARVLPWRSTPTPYRVWISEIMLQQTRVEAVKPYFTRFLAALPDPEALATVSDDALYKLWEGLGYYSRAKNLKKTAKILAEQFSGELPPSYEQLIRLPGIGEYTGGAIASIAFSEPVPAVDGNVLRVLTRLTCCEEDAGGQNARKAARAALTDILPAVNPGDFNQALMELGATVCLPNGAPRCKICPLAGHCLSNERGTQQSYPVKSEKKPRRTESVTVLLLYHNSRVAVRKRPEKGLLAGLYEFPNTPGNLTQGETLEYLKSFGILHLRLQPLQNAKHVFTHVEWRITGWEADLTAQTHGFLWISREELLGEFALPGAFRAYTSAALERLKSED